MARKTVTDTVHGSITLEGAALDLLETLEVQRLNAIRQLGLTYLVFPGANHTRLEHQLGAYHVAKAMAAALALAEEEGKLVAVAALLHDLGHGPFSHTLERVLAHRTDMDHMEVTRRLILGEVDSVPNGERGLFRERPRVPDVLEKAGVEPEAVARLIRGAPSLRALDRFEDAPPPDRPYLGQMVHGVLDADQVDFLLRDALYTGVAHGIIDLPRLLATLRLAEGDLVADRKGLSAVEGFLVARGLMYTSVYFHKTVRIAETMLSRAVERAETDLDAVRFLNDAELMAWLQEQGGFAEETALRLKYRRLYKRILTRDRDRLSGDQLERLAQLGDPERRRRVEDTLCDRVGIPQGRVIVDVPAPELLLTEPRIAQVGLRVWDDGRLLPFRQVSGLAKALQVRETVDWALMVAADAAHTEEVARQAERVLFG